MTMGFTSKIKPNQINSSSSGSSSDNNSWAMGFLFVFFSEENNEEKRKPSFSLSNLSSSPKSSSSVYSFFRYPSNSSHILSRAQSTVSICAMLIFTTLLLFTLSTFEPSAKPTILKPRAKPAVFPHALQGMGALYRRGTRAMDALIVAHAVESATEFELMYFLRMLHRSGVSSKSDVLFVFPRKLSSFDKVIADENDSFSRLLSCYGDKKKNSTSSSSSFDITQFVISSRKERESGQPIWGRSSNKIKEGENVTDESIRLSYGSVVGFDVGELDPENSLFGFFSDHVPMVLRRWACYPMLLGRVRRNYKHIMLVDVKEHLLLGDSLSQLRTRTPQTVIITTLPSKKRNSEKKIANSGFVLGGTRGVRQLANAMLGEIVRGVMQHKKRNLVSEPMMFNQLINNEYILKNVDLIVSGASYIMSRILLKARGVFRNAGTGGAWPSSSARVVRCWVKFCNERNPRIIVEFGTLNRLSVISRRKVRMTLTHHSLYALGDSHATMIRTKSRDLARVS
ncbi:hypothetical protein T459_13669 [Capsicum annuum]|uniref:DUF7780 domain-containing protein n=1 Tax=Capsicum annuum TaxID=4072 RepID=A0A2G2ZFE2_CAPAN|nr:hypothetical protein T459_13669 [Capsicum annuum]